MSRQQKHKISIIKPDYLTGASLGCTAAWSALFFQNLFPGLRENASLLAMKEIGVFLMILGSFSLILFLDLNLKSRPVKQAKTIAFAGLLALTLAAPFLSLPVWAAILIALLSCLLLAVFFLSCFSGAGSFNRVLAVYVGYIVAFIFALSAGAYILDGIGETQIGFTITGCLLLTLGVFISTVTPAQTGEDDSEVPVISPLGKKALALYLLASGIACIIITLQISISFGGFSFPDHAYPVTLLIFAVSGCLIRRLAVRRKMWYIAYVIVTSFALGSVLFVIQPGDVFLIYLSILSLSVALCGMSLLLVTFAFSLAPEKYRRLMVGLGFIYVYSLVFLISGPGAGPHPMLTPEARPLLYGPIILLFFVIPFILRLFSSTLSGQDAVAAAPAADSQPQNPLFGRLTAAEKRVYELVLLGYPNQKIADTLFISINTVKFHVKNILAKAEVKNKYSLPGYGSGTKAAKDSGEPTIQ